MHPTRTILHPTDFSEGSAVAFQIACSQARQDQARLIVLYVAPEATVYGAKPEGTSTDRQIYRRALEDRLREIQVPKQNTHRTPALQTGNGQSDAHKHPPTGEGTAVVVEHRLTHGDAAEEILRTADEVGCDMIVMGTHGRTGLSRAILGSVAEAVVRAAPCPVLTVRNRKCELTTDAGATPQGSSAK
jgi:nucleotide-binding universal stress UspA family protein